MIKYVLFFLLLFSSNSFSENTFDDKELNNNREFLKDTLVINYFLWGGRILYVRNKDSKIFDTSLNKWGNNIVNPEINDGDNFVTNYLYHPYFGALYYQVYRDLGYSKTDSYIGSVIQSTLWEFTIEGTVEKPSIVDLIVTPGLGIPLGIYFEKINEELYSSDSKIKKTLSYLINPTRLFMTEGNLGFYNPLSGTFMIYKPFEYREKNYIDSNLLMSGISINSSIFDVKQYRGGGVDLMYALDINFVDASKGLELKLKFPWAGAYDGNDKDLNVVDNGFEVGNFQMSVNKIFGTTDEIFYGSELSINFSTSSIWGDKKERLQKLHSNSIILKEVLHDSTVFTPKLYIANNLVYMAVSSEIYINAEDYSSEPNEAFIVYDANSNIYESTNKKYKLNLDFKIIDKITEDSSGIDSVGGIGFKIIGNVDLEIKYMKPFNGDIQKYLHDGFQVNLTVPLG